MKEKPKYKVGDKLTKGSSAEKILAAAAEEFAAFGLAGARVDRIAGRSGVNKAMIYYFFNSKENLYHEVIVGHFKKFGSFLEEHTANVTDPDEFFERMSVYYTDMFARMQTFRPLLLREIAAGGGRIKNILSNMISEKGLHKRLKNIIDKGKKEGRYRPVDSQQAILSFISLNIGYFVIAPIFNSIWEIKDEAKFFKKRQKELVDIFLHGLKSR